LEDWHKVDALFGLKLVDDTPDAPQEVYDLMREREECRERKDFARADEIRDRLIAMGYAVKDTASDPIWQYLT